MAEAPTVHLTLSSPQMHMALLAEGLAEDLRKQGLEVTVEKPARMALGTERRHGLPVGEAAEYVLKLIVDNAVWAAVSAPFLLTIRAWKKRRKGKAPAVLVVERFDRDGTLRERFTIRSEGSGKDVGR